MASNQHISAAFYTTSIVLNVLLTTIIVVKLLPTQRNFKGVDDTAKHASSVMGMLAESAALYTLTGVVYICTLWFESDFQVLFAQIFGVSAVCRSSNIVSFAGTIDNRPM
jgi:hypothetical protein